MPKFAQAQVTADDLWVLRHSAGGGSGSLRITRVTKTLGFGPGMGGSRLDGGCGLACCGEGWGSQKAEVGLCGVFRQGSGDGGERAHACMFVRMDECKHEGKSVCVCKYVIVWVLREATHVV